MKNRDKNPSLDEKNNEVLQPLFWDESKLYSLYILRRRKNFSIRMIAKYVFLRWGRTLNRSHMSKKLDELERILFREREINPDLFEPAKENDYPFLIEK